MRHDDRVRDEFTRQAETFSASAAITDAALTQRFIDALGEAARGSVLDVACSPGIPQCCDRENGARGGGVRSNAPDADDGGAALRRGRA